MNTFNILLSKAECCGRQHVGGTDDACGRLWVPHATSRLLWGETKDTGSQREPPLDIWLLALGATALRFPTHPAPRRLRAHVRPSIWRVVSVWEGIVAIGTEWRTWDLGQVPSKSNYLTGRFYPVISVHFWSTQANMYQVKAVSSLIYMTLFGVFGKSFKSIPFANHLRNR